MMRAAVEGARTVDMIARRCRRCGLGGLIMEVIVDTRATLGERVVIPELGAVRCVHASRWSDMLRVVRFTADEWAYLRRLDHQ